MQRNKLIVIINKPIERVFEFTVNPNNTHLWISSITEETSDKYPPKIGTEYKNRGKDANRDIYKVTEFKNNELFALSSLEGNYFVRYTYRKTNDNQTEMEYYEWVKRGELENPFTKDISRNLKTILEYK